MLIPIGVIVYTMFGGLKATYLSSLLSSWFIFVMVVTFSFAVYASNDAVLGSPSKVWNNLNTYVATPAPTSLNDDVLRMLFGWATNCLPLALPARLAFVVAAYSAGDKDLMAASGKYLSPVLDEGFPDLVRHFWSPQFLREVCGAFNLDSPRQPPCTSWQQAVLYGLTTGLHRCRVLPPP